MEQSSKPAVPKPHISWALAKTKGQEHVCVPNFVRKFRFTDKESAYSAYSILIQASQISNKRVARLQQAFTNFKLNRERRFWALKNSEEDTVVSAKESAIITRAVGLKQAKFEYNQHILNLHHIGQGNPSSTIDWDIDYQQDIIVSDDDGEDEDRDVNKSNSEDDNGEDRSAMNEASPEMPQIPANISANHKELLEYALQILSADNHPGTSKNSKSRDFTLSKDVL
ncbi:hypothetical protein BGX27_006547 [Mortierella sp. AM989]|nr:hypothetical protein BGX27_006547 [Mortierella sp. AM989]